jgi:transposase InsO family protein
LINKGYFEIANRRSDRCASDILTAVERSLGKELPQLVLIPLVPQLMKRVDPRIVIGIGFALFAASNFLNISMTNDYAADQLLWPNVVRAVGQALAFAPSRRSRLPESRRRMPSPRPRCSTYRSSRPLSLPSQTPPARCAAVEALRRQRHTGKQIAAEVGVSPATVSRILRRLGLNRLSALEPAEPIRRYQRENPGELIHIDIKKLGKFNRIGHRITGDRTRQSNPRSRGEGPGWEYVQVCIDDASRIAFSQVMKNEKKGCAVALLKAAVAYYVSLGITVERVMTDNGACYKSIAFREACKRLRLKHVRTRPYTPKTNGKAERFIQTSLREWAYAQAYNTSKESAAELPRWLHRYNWHRPHGSLDSKPPISRLGLARNYLLRLHV